MTIDTPLKSLRRIACSKVRDYALLTKNMIAPSICGEMSSDGVNGIGCITSGNALDFGQAVATRCRLYDDTSYTAFFKNPATWR